MRKKPIKKAMATKKPIIVPIIIKTIISPTVLPPSGQDIFRVIWE